MSIIYISIYLCIQEFVLSVPYSFWITGLLPPWLHLFLGNLLFLKILLLVF